MHAALAFALALALALALACAPRASAARTLSETACLAAPWATCGPREVCEPATGTCAVDPLHPCTCQDSCTTRLPSGAFVCAVEPACPLVSAREGARALRPCTPDFCEELDLACFPAPKEAGNTQAY